MRTKKHFFLFIWVLNWQWCHAQIDSVYYNIQDFNYLTAYTEANYAAFPIGSNSLLRMLRRW